MRSLLVLLLVPSFAAAEPEVDRAYVGGGAGLAYDHFFNAFLGVEGAVRIGSLPLWARGSLAWGGAGDFAGGGDFRQVRAGLEAHRCSSRAACFVVGLDAGMQWQTWSDDIDMTEHHEGWLVGGRAGIDAGGESLRFRLSVELYRYARTSDVAALPDAATRGGGLSLAIVHRL